MKDYHFIIPKGFSLFKRLVDYLSNSRLLLAKERGFIAAIKPLLTTLQDQGLYLSPSLLDKALQLADETD